MQAVSPKFHLVTPSTQSPSIRRWRTVFSPPDVTKKLTGCITGCKTSSMLNLDCWAQMSRKERFR